MLNEEKTKLTLHLLYGFYLHAADAGTFFITVFAPAFKPAVKSAVASAFESDPGILISALSSRFVNLWKIHRKNTVEADSTVKENMWVDYTFSELKEIEEYDSQYPNFGNMGG